MRRGERAQRHDSVQSGRIGIAAQAEIDAIDQRLDLVLPKRQAHIDGAVGADQIGGQIVLALRVDAAGCRQDQRAGFQIAAFDADASFRRNGCGKVDLGLSGKELAHQWRQQPIRLPAALQRDPARSIGCQAMTAIKRQDLVSANGADELARPVRQRSIAIEVDGDGGSAGKTQ